MSTHTKIYLSGPMSGYAAFNIPTFDREADRLRRRGFEVVSPAELDDPVFRDLCLECQSGRSAELDELVADYNKEQRDPTKRIVNNTWGELLARDVQLLSDNGIETIVLLPGWETSRGARLESFVGMLNNIPLYELIDTVLYAVDDVTWYVKTAPEVDLTTISGIQIETGSALPPGFEVPGGYRATTNQPKRYGVVETIQQDAVTGGKKGVKPERYDLLPFEMLDEDARLYNAGCVKYEAHNWRKGFPMSSAFSSAMRHLTAWWQGQETDPETGVSHLAAARFHCAALFYFHRGIQTGQLPCHLDDRWKGEV